MSGTPKHRRSPLRGFWSEVVYLIGRIGLVVVLLTVAVILIVASLVAAGFLFIQFVEHFSE